MTEDHVASRYQYPIAPPLTVPPTTTVPAKVQTTSAAPLKDAKAEISAVFRCDGKDYWRSKKYIYSYDQAVQQCALGGGRLITMRTKSVYDCIAKELLKAGAYSGSNYYIGLKRTGHGKNDFMWSDGSPLKTIDYTNWGKYSSAVDQPMDLCQELDLAVENRSSHVSSICQVIHYSARPVFRLTRE